MLKELMVIGIEYLNNEEFEKYILTIDGNNLVDNDGSLDWCFIDNSVEYAGEEDIKCSFEFDDEGNLTGCEFGDYLRTVLYKENNQIYKVKTYAMWNGCCIDEGLDFTTLQITI